MNLHLRTDAASCTKTCYRRSISELQQQQMFVTDRIIYLQLHKTGCTHVSNLLSKICSGQKIGKHNNLPKEWQESNKYIVGSIRNPWDWYVSLWAYGCGRQGGLYHRLAF